MSEPARSDEPSGLLAPDVVQFISLVISQLVVLTVYLVLFAVLRWKRPELFRPSFSAESPVACARSVAGWLREIVRLDEHSLYSKGGIDSVLHARALALNFKLALLLTVTGIPLLLVFALAPGSPKAVGFSRIALTHVLAPPTVGWAIWLAVVCAWANTLIALRLIDNFDRDAHAFALARTRDTGGGLHHYAVTVTDIPPGAGAREVRLFFGSIHGEQAVLGVHMVRKYSLVPRGTPAVPKTPTAKEAAKGGSSSSSSAAGGSMKPPERAPHKAGIVAKAKDLLAERHSVRSGVAAFAKALSQLANAEAAVAAAAADGSLAKFPPQPDLTKSAGLCGKADPRIKAMLARERARNVQAALGAALRLLPPAVSAKDGEGAAGASSLEELAAAAERTTEDETPTAAPGAPARNAPPGADAAAAASEEAAAAVPDARAAIVVFDSLVTAACAASSAYRVTGGDGPGPTEAWTVKAAAEPRETIWRSLESLAPPSARAKTRLLLRLLKAGAFIFWSALVGALAVGVQAALSFLARVPSAELRAAITVISGIVPVLLANVLLQLMSSILRVLALKLGGVWSESQAGASVQADYTLFLIVVAFFAPMLATSLWTALLALGESPLSVLPLLAGAVPFSAYPLIQLAFLKSVQSLTAMTMLVPAVLRLLKAKLGLARTPFALSELARAAKPKSEVVRASWAAWAQLVLLCYAPIAPIAAPFAALYFGASLLEAKLEIGVTGRIHFDSAGLLATVTARTAARNALIASIVHLAVIGLAGSTGSYGHVFLLIPLPLPVLLAISRISTRALHGMHGKASGRLPLIEAAVLDQQRPRERVLDAHAVFADFLKGWEPPEATGGGSGAGLCGPLLAGSPLLGGVGSMAASEERQEAAATAAAHEGDERQQQLWRWLRRYESPDAVAFPSEHGVAGPPGSNPIP